MGDINKEVNNMLNMIVLEQAKELPEGSYEIKKLGEDRISLVIDTNKLEDKGERE